MQLGLELLKKDDYIKKILKEWDARGKGELLKGELRQNLRNIGLNATSVEADQLFDSWDVDGSGYVTREDFLHEERGLLRFVRATLLRDRDRGGRETDGGAAPDAA